MIATSGDWAVCMAEAYLNTKASAVDLQLIVLRRATQSLLVPATISYWAIKLVGGSECYPGKRVLELEKGHTGTLVIGVDCPTIAYRRVLLMDK